MVSGEGPDTLAAALYHKDRTVVGSALMSIRKAAEAYELGLPYEERQKAAGR
jgi:hypothetical protein